MFRSILPAIACFIFMGILTGSVAAHQGFEAEIRALEAKLGGRVGVTIIDSEKARQYSHRGEERFALCSTFKWALAAQALSEADAGRLSLDERLAYTEADLLAYAPVTQAHVGEGSMSIKALAAAAVSVSDNTAANLLLARLGGPKGFTAYLRNNGDALTRLDRLEPALNENAPGDERDTTTPDEMAATLHHILTGDALSGQSRALLSGWMAEATTGLKRLRAGLPDDWLVGDKTGTCGSRGAANDVAIVLPVGHRKPAIIAAYLSDSDATAAELDAAHAAIGRIAAQLLR